MDIDRLNERFLKDFNIKIDPAIAYTDYFYERFNATNKFNDVYNEVIKYIDERIDKNVRK